jgi:hypothetical protein
MAVRGNAHDGGEVVTRDHPDAGSSLTCGQARLTGLPPQVLYGVAYYQSSNWSWEPARLEMPVGGSDLLSGAVLATGEQRRLGAWDVRVLLEEPPEEYDEGRAP